MKFIKNFTVLETSLSIIVKGKKAFVDYLFWMVFILFTNPGGIQNGLGINELRGGLNFNDFLILIMLFCYVVSTKTKAYKNLYYNRIALFLFIFSIYYLIGFSYIVPKYNDNLTSFINVLIKIRHTFYSFLLFFFTYRFFQRSYQIFFKLFVYSSILILSLFLFSILLGKTLLPILTFSRGFIDINRIMLISYGIMPFLIPLGITFLLFRSNTNYKYFVYISFVLMALTWLVSLTRRHIFGSIFYFFIGYFLLTYFTKVSFAKKIQSVFRTLIILFGLVFTINLLFPEYLSSGAETLNETFYTIEHGKTTAGDIDERISLSRPFIIQIINENWMIGTGYENRWRTDIGDSEGYEASDYPFLAAIAMFGVMGILLFVPIYYYLINALLKDIRFIKKVKSFDNKLLFLLFISFIIWFIYDFMRYFDWFHPISNPVNNYWYYILGFYLAARKMFYIQINLLNKRSL